MRLFRNFELKRDQILVLIKKDFKLKYDSTALGMLWSIVTPLSMSLVYYFVFGKMMRWGDGPFALYIVSGNFLWHYFSAIVMQSGCVLVANSSLLKKTSFDRRLLVWGTYCTESIHFLLTIPVLVGVMFVFGVVPDPLTFLPNVLVAMLSMMYFSVGFGYVYAALNICFKDLQRIMSIIMMMWLYASPVFIPVSRVPQQYLWVYEINPIAQILMTWRDAFYEPAIHPERFLPMLGVSLSMFLVGRMVFRRYEPRFAEMM